MARNNTMFPVPKGGTGRLLGILIVLVLLVLVIKDPVGAAAGVHKVWSGLNGFLDSLGRFGAAVTS